MRKITFLLLFIANIITAQVIEGVSFDWTDHVNYQINGETELTFKPGDVITANITYTLGTTDGMPNTFNFLLFRLETAASSAMNEAAPDATSSFLPAGTESGGVWTTSTTYIIPATSPLTSTDPSIGYRINAYLSYNKGDGSGPLFGQNGGSFQPNVFIRSQTEIDALSTKDFQKFSSFYPNPVNDKIYFKNDVQTDSYKVLSVTGALIREVDGSKRSIDISDLKSGLYFIATDDSVGKFVKQ